MPLSHTCTDGATGNSDHLDQILSDLGTESRRLSERAPAEQDFERFCLELPDVREYAESAQEAYDLTIDTIETAAAMFAETARPFPPPASPQDEFSGRVTLRLPRSLHRALASAAEDEGVSLNQHLVTALARLHASAGATRHG